MKAHVSWHHGVSFVAESGSGHATIVDGALNTVVVILGLDQWN